MQYLALLRGINVGGNNIIKMDALRTCFEDMGFDDVSTYIQTGNVFFSAPRTSEATLRNRISARLKKEFNYSLPIAILTKAQLKQVMDEAPKSFERKPVKHRDDVLFFVKPLNAKTLIADIPLREGVDTVSGGKRALYFSRVKGKESQSLLNKIVQMPFYQDITIRNWNTTSTLWEKMSSSA